MQRATRYPPGGFWILCVLYRNENLISGWNSNTYGTLLRSRKTGNHWPRDFQSWQSNTVCLPTNRSEYTPRCVWRRQAQHSKQKMGLEGEAYVTKSFSWGEFTASTPYIVDRGFPFFFNTETREKTSEMRVSNFQIFFNFILLRFHALKKFENLEK